MNYVEQLEYGKLRTIEEKAKWLLERTPVAKLDVVDTTMSLCWRVYYAGVMLPGWYIGTETEALSSANKWLRERAGLEVAT